jgi:hypothetical protein
MPYDKKPGAAVRMYDKKGKPAGLMAEGSMAYMEYISQEKKNLMQDMPIDNRGVGEMSPYKMDHGDSAAKFTGMSGGSSLHVHEKGHKEEKKKLTEAEFIDRELTKLMKENPNMTPEQVLKESKNLKGLYKQYNVGSL